jgi:hypothetical protein
MSYRFEIDFENHLGVADPEPAETTANIEERTFEHASAAARQ